ncbi:MAG: 3-dehydroquinate synthase [SAR202 cluster bacterium]|nr:3-dehydroquinate synthase [SAR202 cluster bacterium]
MKANIFLTGFSGAGKSTVGREVARRMGWTFVDTDAEIVRIAGKPIPAIFSEDGEATFRQLEHKALAGVCARDRQVVSTGGGIVTRASNRALMQGHGIAVCLEAEPETIYERLREQNAHAETEEVRPMLAAADPLKRIGELKAKRQRHYALAHWTVHTDRLSPQAVAGEVVHAWQLLAGRTGDDLRMPEADVAATVHTSSGDYPVWVGWGLLDQFGQRAKTLLSLHAAYVVTDEGAYRHGRKVQTSLERVGIPSHFFVVERGEQHKTLDTIRLIYNWLASLKAERGHLVVAVGGGVVGDMAGFAAATYLRGMPFAQVPTTLLAMMDSSIGGKTGVDLPQGKNLVGAFHQPRFVLADVATLQTLQDKERRAGWAEAIKHALIMDEQLLRTFEEHAGSVMTLERETTTDIVRRSVAIKGRVVSQDEKETLGIRTLLNYGHTIGHAIEATTGYTKYLHGEAVSIGMMAAAYISRDLGMLTPKDVSRQKAVLSAYGLPTSTEGLDANALHAAIKLDKKVVGKRIRWVLLDGIGHAVVRDDVPADVVERAIAEVSSER